MIGIRGGIDAFIGTESLTDVAVLHLVNRVIIPLALLKDQRGIFAKGCIFDIASAQDRCPPKKKKKGEEKMARPFCRAIMNINIEDHDLFYGAVVGINSFLFMNG